MSSNIIRWGAVVVMAIAGLFWFSFLFGFQASSFGLVYGVASEYWGVMLLSCLPSLGLWLYHVLSTQKQLRMQLTPLLLWLILCVMILLITPVLTVLGISSLVDDSSLPPELKGKAFTTALQGIFGVTGAFHWREVLWSTFILTLQHLWFVSQVMLTSLGLGVWIKRFIPEKISRGLRSLLLLAAGLVILQVFLFTLGLWGLIGTLPGDISILLPLAALGGVIVYWRERDIFLNKVTLTLSPLRVFLGIVLIVICATTLAHIMRPIPIGWDDTSVYMNIPRLLMSGGELITGYGMYNWGLVMTLGFLEGKASMALLASSLGGVLSLLAVYVGIREVSCEKTSASVWPLLLTTVLAVTPMFLFQLGEDLKVDLAMLFFSVVAMILAILWSKFEAYRTWKVATLIGVFLGVAIGIKVTAVLVVLFVGVLFALRVGGLQMLFALALLFSSIVFGFDLLSFSGVEIESGLRYGMSIVLGLLALILTMKKHVPWKEWGHGGVVIAMMLLFLAPWLSLNYQSLCTDGCVKITTEGLLFGKAEAPILPDTDMHTEQEVNVEVTRLSSDVAAEGGAKKEEVARYRGFDTGMMHYLSLPFDVTVSKNIAGDYVTVGWVYLALLYLVGISIAFYKQFSVWSIVLSGTLGLVALLFILEGVLPEVPSWFAVALPLGCYIAATVSTWKLSRDYELPMLHHIYIAMLTFGLAWIFLGSGVPWYGISGFAMTLLLGAMMMGQDDTSSKYIKYFIVFFWVLPMFFYRFAMTSTHQVVLGMEQGKITLDQIELRSYDQRQFALYKAGLLDDNEAFKAMNPAYFEASVYLNEHKGNIYRVGTLLPYFIESNNTRMLTDNQLDLFLQHYTRHGSTLGFVSDLREGGFEYIIYDQNTASIEKEGQDTLKRKTELFEEVLSEDQYFDKVYSGGGFEIYNVL